MSAVAPGPQRVTIPDADLGTFVLMRRWLDYLEVSGRCNAETRMQYRRYVVTFFAEILRDLREVTEDDVVEFLRTRSPAMRGATLRALRSLFVYALDRGFVDANPCRHLPVPPDSFVEDPPFHDSEELAAVWTAAERVDPRARPTLEFMFYTGARIGSMVEVMPEDLDFEAHEVRFRVAKYARPYTNPMPPGAEAAATSLLELIDWCPPTVVSRRPTLVGVGKGTVSRWAQRAGEISGIPTTSHVMRHSFAERLVNDPAIPDMVAADLLNHVDTKLLRRYARGRTALKHEASAHVQP